MAAENASEITDIPLVKTVVAIGLIPACVLFPWVGRMGLGDCFVICQHINLVYCKMWPGD